MPSERAGDWAQTKKNPRGWKNVFTPLTGLAVWANRAILALDQWDKLLESGQLWQIAQKEKSLPLQKIGFCHHVLYLYPSTIPTKKCEVKWESIFFLPWILQNIWVFIVHWLFCVEGEAEVGTNWGGGVCRRLCGERGGCLLSPADVNFLSDVGSWQRTSTKRSPSCF